MAAAFDHAARTTGFFSVTGHGVDPNLIHEMLDVTAAFFDLPVEEKMRYFLDDRTANRGYAPEGSEALAYSLGEPDLPTDLFEAFNIGCELTDEQLADPYYSSVHGRTLRPMYGHPFLPGCGTPGSPTSRRSTPSRTTRCRRRRWRWACRWTILPYLDKGPTVMRANNYQRRPALPNRCPGRCAWARAPTTAASPCSSPTRFPGCRSATSGVWHAVLPPEGSFIVNLGDLLAEWSNDGWRSTLHRVVPPPPTASDSSAADRSPGSTVHRELGCGNEVPLPTCSDSVEPSPLRTRHLR